MEVTIFGCAFIWNLLEEGLVSLTIPMNPNGTKKASKRIVIIAYSRWFKA
jgi:hypothetical protein